MAPLSLRAFGPPSLERFLLCAPVAETVTIELEGPEIWTVALECLPDSPGAVGFEGELSLSPILQCCPHSSR